MFNKIPSFNEISSNYIYTIKRFPMSIILSFLLTFICIYFIDVKRDITDETYLLFSKSILFFSLAIFIFTFHSLINKNISLFIRRILIFFFSVSLLIYYYILPNNIEDFSSNLIIYRHVFLCLIFLISFLWAPFIFFNETDEDYWLYPKQVLFSFLITSLFTLLLILGVNGAIFSLERLFELEVSTTRYFQVDVFIIGIFSIFYFLHSIPNKPLKLKYNQKNSKIEYFFTKWLLTPLSIIYFIILYSYSFKVLYTLDWPKSILSWLIIFFSIFSILTFLFWTHFLQNKYSKFRRWIWLAVLFQTFMLFSAVLMRINEYSFTESRYMVFALGIWLSFISLYFLIFKKTKIKWIFISLSLVITFTQIGPFNAYTVTKKEQTVRLEERIKKLKDYKDSNSYPLKLRYEISSIVNFFYNRDKKSSLKMIFPDITRDYENHMKKIKEQNNNSLNNETIKLNKISSYYPEFITEKLGFKFLSYWQYKDLKDGIRTYTRYYKERQNLGLINIKGFDFMYYLDLSNSIKYVDNKSELQEQNLVFEKFNLSIKFTKTYILEVSQNNSTIYIDINNYFENLVKKHGYRNELVDNKDLIIEKSNKKFKIKLELNSINKYQDNDLNSISLIGNLFIKKY